MPLCGICFSERAICLTCPKCEFVSCSFCIKEYFKTQPEPICPNCHLEFTREIISKEINSPAVMKLYKTMREKYLLDLEKARLPESQGHVEIIRIHENFRETRPALAKKLRELEREVANIKQQLDAHCTVLTFMSRHQYVDARLHHEQYFDGDNVHTKKKGSVRETINILCPCPTEKCRGFVLTKQEESKTSGSCGSCGRVGRSGST